MLEPKAQKGIIITSQNPDTKNEIHPDILTASFLANVIHLTRRFIRRPKQQDMMVAASFSYSDCHMHSSVFVPTAAPHILKLRPLTWKAAASECEELGRQVKGKTLKSR